MMYVKGTRLNDAVSVRFPGGSSPERSGSTGVATVGPHPALAGSTPAEA